MPGRRGSLLDRLASRENHPDDPDEMDRLEKMREERLEAAFKMFDKDGSGTVSAAELCKVLVQPTGESKPLTQNEAMWLIRRFDKDDDGLLDISEFASVFSRLHRMDTSPQTADAMTAALELNAARDLGKAIELQTINPKGVGKEEIRRAFDIFDRDGNGTLSAHELRSVLMTPSNGGRPLTHAEATALIGKFDKDGDGTMSIDEFVTAFGTVFPLTKLDGPPVVDPDKRSSRFIPLMGPAVGAMGSVMRNMPRNVLRV